MNNANHEIEYKFLLDDEAREKLINHLHQNGAVGSEEDEQDNWYYQAPGEYDLRIRRTNDKAYLILKRGWMHNENREEIEIPVERDHFEALDSILRQLGYEYDTKWYRKRIEYHHQDLNITLDFNAGYGWVVEIEKVVPSNERESAKEQILQFAESLGLSPTPKEVFDKMYNFYKKNWPHYIETKSVFRLEDIKTN